MYVFLEETNMTGTHTIFTEHLTHILRDIALNQRTGLLRVDCIHEHFVEKGAIFFKSGNTVFACTERQMGEQALLHIVSWDRVYYSFLEGVQLAIQQGRASARYTPTRNLLTPMPRKEAPHTPPATVPVIPQNTRSLMPTFNAVPMYVPSSPIEEATNLGIHTIFRALPKAATPEVTNHIERQDRVVFMLLDGKRTVHDIAHLVHRSEPDVARTLARLLKRGYIECVPEEEKYREPDVAHVLARLFANE